jgi:hypothetical protein
VRHDEDVRGPLSAVVHLLGDPLGAVDWRILVSLCQINVGSDQFFATSNNLKIQILAGKYFNDFWREKTLTILAGKSFNNFGGKKLQQFWREKKL